MVSSYEAVATKIKNYLTENNLGELVKEEDEKKYKDFYNLFAPEILEKLEGKEVRDKIFSHDSDKTTLVYNLEASKNINGFVVEYVVDLLINFIYLRKEKVGNGLPVLLKKIE